MIDDAIEITNYLPYYYSNKSEGEYIEFLWDAFESNYRGNKFQFAFIAYHMLFMSAVYCQIWKIKLIHENDFNKALIGFAKDEKQLLDATTPFTFHTLPERSVFRFFKLMGCPNDIIGRYQKIVDDRNSSAHSNGNVFLGNKASLDVKLSAILTYLAEIHRCFISSLDEYYKLFLTESSNQDERQYIDDMEQINEVLLRPHYFSLKEIACFYACDISLLNKHPDYATISALHETLKKNMKEDIEPLGSSLEKGIDC